jgi:hypothetical protein
MLTNKDKPLREPIVISLNITIVDNIKSNHILDIFTNLFERRITKFPGTLPVSLSKETLVLLRYGYVFAVKADGDRVFVLIEGNTMIIIPRDLNIRVFSIDIHHENLFVFDCELLENGEILIFDTLVFASVPVTKSCISVRYEYARTFLAKSKKSTIIPIHELDKYCIPSNFSSRHFIEIQTVLPEQLVKKLPNDIECLTKSEIIFKKEDDTNRHEKMPVFKMFAKRIFYFQHVLDVWDRQSLLPYNNDGLIFTRLFQKYTPFRDDKESVIKFKPPDQITCDFLVLASQKVSKTTYISGMPDLMFTTPSATYKTHNSILLTTPINFYRPIIIAFANVDDTTIHGKIAEFGFFETEWALHRIRHDKTVPNNIETVIKTIENMFDIINVEDLQ